MSRLNAVGAELGSRGLVRAATDLTGFGLMGHLASLCRASGVSAEIDARAVPVLSQEVFRLIERGCVPGGSRDNRAAADEVTDWGDADGARRTLLTDAQTSGGLLLCVNPARLASVQSVLKRHHTPAAA